MYKLGLIIAVSIVLQASAPWASTVKYAVVVGNNEGHESKRQLRYAEADAQKFYNVLTEIGGFDRAGSSLLLGKSAKQVEAALQRIEQKIKQDRKQKKKTLLLFFYSGHAEGEVLQLGTSAMGFATLKKHLTDSKADVRLGLLDSCRSGRLIRDKGGRPGPDFSVHLVEEIASSGFAIITSSAEDEVSQETEELRGGFFTHYLVSALRGAADVTGDGKVTLEEAYAYAYTRTAARTSTALSGGQHPMYQFELKGKGDIVLTRPVRSASKLSVTMQKPGRLLLLDKNGETLIAESDVTAGGKTEFAVGPGKYRLYYVGAKGKVMGASPVARSGEHTQLNQTHFSPTKLETTVSKGGLFLKSQNPWEHRLGVAGGWRLFGMEGGTSAYGAALSYRLKAPGGLQPVARFLWSSRPDTELVKNYNDFSLQVGLGYMWAIERLILRAELLVGGDLMRQSDVDGQSAYSTGYSYLGLVGVEWPLQQWLFVALSGGAGGRFFVVQGEGTVHRFDAQVMMALGWRWES